jgi:hypothetical protein
VAVVASGIAARSSQHGRVLHHGLLPVVALFRWSDLTVQKVMFAAILVGMVGVYSLHGFGLVNLHIKPMLLGANILGGLIFGVRGVPIRPDQIGI